MILEKVWRYRIVLGIILVILLLLLGFLMVGGKSLDERLVLFIEKKGFQNEGDSSLYYKTTSDDNYDSYQEKSKNDINSVYEAFCFDVNNYRISKQYMSYDDGIVTNFTPLYDYKTDALTFTYRVVGGDANFIFEGSYSHDDDEFVCKNIYSSLEIESEEGIICDKIRYDVEDFYYEMIDIVNQVKLVKWMKNIG